MPHPLEERIKEFVQQLLAAMGMDVAVRTESTVEGVAVRITGADGDLLVRRRGEALDALQHIVNMVFRRQLDEEQRVEVDAGGFRAAKSAELRQMAQFMMDRVQETGSSQELGPLNPYERRIVHLAVAESGAIVSESVGSGFLKTIVLRKR